MLYEKYYVPVINVFAHSHSLALFMHFIEMRVEIAKICLILLFGGF